MESIDENGLSGDNKEELRNANDEVTSEIKDGNSNTNIQSNEIKRNAGRPKGSRSIGLTKLKKLNPGIQMLDKDIGGSECGVNNCAVRLKDDLKLDYHKKCHKDAETDSKLLFECPECKKETNQNG